MTTRATIEGWARRWLHRSDFTADDLTDAIDAVTMDLSTRLRSDANEKSVSLAATEVTANPITLAADFQQFRSVSVGVQGGPYPLEAKSIPYVQRFLRGGFGTPAFYALIDGGLWIAPFQSVPLDYVYYNKLSEIGAQPGDTNAVLTAYPDLYRYGVLAQCSLLTQDIELAESYGALYDGRVIELNTAKKWQDLGDKPQAGRA